ncbi:MAG: sulfatase-like hydrolase/transferase [Clostridia bacterium]|nr:sulfatase-like hydrolase/transferase [Clostridia bacterium]
MDRNYRKKDVKRAQTRRPTKERRENPIVVLLSLFFLPAFLFFCEFTLKISLFGSIDLKELFLALLFSASTGITITLVCRAIACGIASLAENKQVIRPLCAVLVGICSAAFLILFLVQYVYFSFFGDFFKWSTLDMAGDVTQFYRETLATMAKGWYWILLFAAPIALYVIFPAKRMPRTYMSARGTLVLITIALLCHFIPVAVIHLDSDEYGDKTYYTQIFDAPYAVKNFGLLTETRLDIKQLMFGSLGDIEDDEIGGDTMPPINQTPDILLGTDSQEPDDSSAPTGDGTNTTDVPEVPKEYGYNVMNIDFESLIANAPNKTIKGMHEYFSSIEPTKQNKYTGYFEGKNLIFITLEGFSHKVISEELTPTLYKMATEGFVFKNFYNSLWGGSTATGEYAVVTGNFYDSAKVLEMSAKTYQPFVLGNMLKSEGYKTTAYHNHTYTYYTRNKSHPNFGYEWIAIGNGLTLPSQSWPNSDYQMAQVTAPSYVSSEPFHTYYMTVSGHALYTFTGNSMARKHKLRVSHLTQYSENVQAYIACNLEVEDMLTELMAQLEAAGTLDDTVFVISEDHYPYALEKSEIAELYGLPNDDNLFSNFDLYRNFFTVYSTSMKEPVIVNEPCSAIDILPTVLNLFGLEYDSRIISGTDVLSTTPNTVILNCDQTGPKWNWITRYGSYNTQTKVFTPAEGVTFASEAAQAEYVDSMKKLVSLKRKYSHLIVEENYYKYVFK